MPLYIVGLKLLQCGLLLHSGEDDFSVSVYFWCRVDLKHRKYAAISPPSAFYGQTKEFSGMLSI